MAVGPQLQAASHQVPLAEMPDVDVRVRLDRIRRALAITQPRQVLVDQLDRPQIRADDRERLDPARRQEHPAHDIARLSLVDVVSVQDAGNITVGSDVKAPRRGRHGHQPFGGT